MLFFYTVQHIKRRHADIIAKLNDRKITDASVLEDKTLVESIRYYNYLVTTYEHQIKRFNMLPEQFTKMELPPPATAQKNYNEPSMPVATQQSDGSAYKWLWNRLQPKDTEKHERCEITEPFPKKTHLNPPSPERGKKCVT